jgi:hypothetical protein
MNFRNFISVFLFALLASAAWTPLATAQEDPIYVDTFRNEFINWATPHSIPKCFAA